jgi:two-component system sensor histidine kinase BarA
MTFRSNSSAQRLLKKHKLKPSELMNRLQGSSGKLYDQIQKHKYLNNSSFILRTGDIAKRYCVFFSKLPGSYIIRLYGYKKKYARQEYERMQKQQNRFLCSLSHEFNTPLNHIIASLEMLDISSLKEDLAAAIKISLSGAEQMQYKIQDLVDYASIEYGQFKENTSLFKVEELFNDLSKVYDIEAKQKSIYVNFKTEKPYLNIMADYKRIKQVLSALIQNAVHFTESGGVKVTVLYQNTSAIFKVEDTGCGMDELKMKTLFRRNHMPISYDFEKSIDAGELYGMGLCVAQMICQKLGTLIIVKSVKSIGSSFSFTIGNCLVSKTNLATLKYTRVNSQRKFELKSHMALGNKINANHCRKQSFCEKEGGNHVTEYGDEVPDELPYHTKILQVRKSQENVPSLGALKAIKESKLICFPTAVEADQDTPMPASPNHLKPTVLQCRTARSVENNMVNDEEKTYQEFFNINEEVLVVDDDPFNRVVVEKLFKALNVKVLTAQNGYEALRIVKETSQPSDMPFKLILMDINMPGINGIRCTLEMLNFWDINNLTPCPIVALTASNSDIDKKECLSIGMSDFISKPITNKLVSTLIQKYINNDL